MTREKVCPHCMSPAVNLCRTCKATIIRNRRGEIDAAYIGDRKVYARRSNSSLELEPDGPRRTTIRLKSGEIDRVHSVIDPSEAWRIHGVAPSNKLKFGWKDKRDVA